MSVSVASTNRFELLGAEVPDHPNSPTATDSILPRFEVIEESSAAPAEDDTVPVDEELQKLNDGVTVASLRRPYSSGSATRPRLPFSQCAGAARAARRSDFLC